MSSAVLGIETSCDETAVGLVVDGHLLADRTTRQVLHEKYGGVVPELASRTHEQLLQPAVDGVLADAGLTVRDLTAVAATYGPGLAGALLVGVSYAKGLAAARQIPWIAINHLEGHIWAGEMGNGDIPAPFLVLLASGGHTLLIRVDGFGKYLLLGGTRDDAAGELFDKVGRMLGIPFPAGAVLDREAMEFVGTPVQFPRARMKEDPMGFSFSGLKTAVLYHLRSHFTASGPNFELPAHERQAIAAGIMDSVADMLLTGLENALATGDFRAVVFAGGVASSRFIRRRMEEFAGSAGVPFLVPPTQFCTDNGAMIAYAGWRRTTEDRHSPMDLGIDPAAILSQPPP